MKIDKEAQEYYAQLTAFYQQFRRIGNNYNQWINDFRIDYLLGRIHSGKKLSDLAEEAGFASTDAFYRNFKRKTGLTPNEYLKQHPKKHRQRKPNHLRQDAPFRHINCLFPHTGTLLFAHLYQV